MRRTPAAYLLALGLAAALALALGGCTGDEGRPMTEEPSPSTSQSPSRPTEEPSLPSAGSSPLAWQRVAGPVETTVTTSGKWTLRHDQTGTEATLDGPEPATISAPRRHRITDALIDGSYAVVVTEDELAEQPNVATVIDLDNGERFSIDGSSDVPTTTGGTWSLGEGQLLHATIGRGRAYCLATVDLATRESETSWCAPDRHGFNGSRITPAGSSLMTFDDQQPSCRTVAAVEGDQITAFAGVPDCTGWDGAVLDDGAIWSVVKKANRIESAHFYARIGDGYFDLGPGTSGSLVWCADAAYFVRDPQRQGDPARLMRWTARASLDVVYETRGNGQAFLTEPRCGGEWISLTAFAESGDEQVTAPVGPAGQ